ncbi:hypothetical protein [Tenacibaculum discolor]|uniref:hypothetical protein n=1 Tax=Tenacibaculum discolor TaxID=361581 RepID=UPI003F79E89B
MSYIQITISILNLAFIFYIAFFKSYITEKGKNYATKEDIEEITKKIETVKNEVSFSNSQKSEWLDKNKVALLNYFDNYVHWTEHGINNISLIINNPFGSEKIRSLIDELYSIKTMSDKSYWQLCLFEYNDKEFTDKVRDIHLEAIKLHDIIFEFLIKMEQYAIYFELALKHNYEVDPKKNDEKIKVVEKFVKEKGQEEKAVLKNAPKLMGIMRKKISEKYK